MKEEVIMQILVREEKLSDKSKVYSVVVYSYDLPEGEDRIVFECVSEKDARYFAEGLEKLIRSHTNYEV